ncbi:MAG: hypothetical protein ACTSQS_17810, partial [Promethearchaeota archaeon]
MAGRKKKELIPIFRDLIIIMKGVVDLMLGKIQIKCTLCGSWKVAPNGTRIKINVPEISELVALIEAFRAR